MNTTDEKQTEEIVYPLPRSKKRVQKSKGGFKGWFTFSILLLIAAACFLSRHDLSDFISSILKEDDNTKWEFSLPFNAKRQNILLMGVDVSENPDKPFENTRSDSIYLITITSHAKNVNVISIPRDSKVYIHSRQTPDKINHAFAYGGINTSIKTIEQTLGVKINHYLVVSNKALIDFIDKIGGVDVYVEKDMLYDDYTAGLHVNLKKGVQHLDGKDSEGFMRFRKDSLGDIGRIRRQQWFLGALAQKLKDPSIIVKIPEIIKSCSKYIQTDLSFYELAQYAALIKSFDLSRIQIATLPGEPSQRGIISYWILDPAGVQRIVNKLVYGEKPKTLGRPLEAGILYTSSREEDANTLKTELEENGVNVNLRQVKYLSHDHIAIHNLDIPNDAISSLKLIIKEMRGKQTVYDTIGINKAARDFTVVLAGQ